MISDRDPRFTSHFGKALTTKLGISRNLSTAFHPQTNGLSERKNQWVEQYLCLVTLVDPKGWVNWLTLATTVHVTRQVVVYHIFVTSCFIWILGISEMGYLERFVSRFGDLRDGISREIHVEVQGSWRWDISRDIAKTCTHLRTVIRG